MAGAGAGLDRRHGRRGAGLSRRRFGFGVWLAVCLFGAGALPAQDAPVFVVRPTAKPCLKLRTGPQSTAAVVTCVTPGTRMAGLAAAPYWRRVRLDDGRTAWAAKKFLDVVPGEAGPPAAPADREDAWLEIHVVDVGQGDGIWIHTFDDGVPGNGRYEGRNIIIDGGPDGTDGRNALLAYVLAQAHENAVVDALVVTHPHSDHFPGALGVLRHFEVRAYYDPGYPKEGRQYAQFLAAVRAETVEGRPIALHIGREQLGTPDWGDELDVRFVYAYPGSPAGLGAGNTLENNASIVLRLTYGSQRILLMGDAEGKDREDTPDTARYVERILLDQLGPEGLRSTVLKVAHHGSETSSTLPFIRAVDPDYVIVSSGRRSFNGRFLPDRSTLARYCAHRPTLRIFRTDQDDEIEGRTARDDADGDHVIVRTNGRMTVVEGRSAGNPFAPTTCAP